MVRVFSQSLNTKIEADVARQAATTDKVRLNNIIGRLSVLHLCNFGSLNFRESWEAATNSRNVAHQFDISCVVENWMRVLW